MCINAEKQEICGGMSIFLPPDQGISMSFITEYTYWAVSIFGKNSERLKESVTETFVCEDTDQKLYHLLKRCSDSGFEEKLCQLIQERAGMGKERKPGKRRNPIVSEAVRYIDQNPCLDFSIGQMAKDLNVSQAYLSRIFKKEMNITPKQYMIQSRLRSVKKQMDVSDSEIQLAFDNGFAAESHLCTVFKKYMGISITDYKNSLTAELSGGR